MRLLITLKVYQLMTSKNFILFKKRKIRNTMKVQEKFDHLNNIFQNYDPMSFNFLPFKITDKAKFLIQDKLSNKEVSEEELDLLLIRLEGLIQGTEKHDTTLIIEAQQSLSDLLENKPWNIFFKKFSLDTKTFIHKVTQLLILNEKDALEKISKNSELILGSKEDNNTDAVSSISQSYFKSYDNAIQACDCVLNPKVIKDIIEKALEAVKTLKISLSDSPIAEIREMLQESETRLREFHSALIYRINEKINGSHLLEVIEEVNETKIILTRNPKHIQKIPTTKNLLNFQIYDAVCANQLSYQRIKDLTCRANVKQIVLKDTLESDLKDFIEEMRNDQLTLSIHTADLIQQELALNLVYQLLWEDEIPVVASN
jgi:hypothetical protein